MNEVLFFIQILGAMYIGWIAGGNIYKSMQLNDGGARTVAVIFMWLIVLLLWSFGMIIIRGWVS